MLDHSNNVTSSMFNLLLVYCNHTPILRKREFIFVATYSFNASAFWGTWFASTLFSKYLAISKNHSFNSSSQHSHRLFHVVSLWMHSVSLDNCHVIYRVHILNLSNQKSPRKRSKSWTHVNIEKTRFFPYATLSVWYCNIISSINGAPEWLSSLPKRQLLGQAWVKLNLNLSLPFLSITTMEMFFFS